MSDKSEKDNASIPSGDVSPDLGGPGANLGTHGGTGADSGGTGAGTTALDAIGSQGNRESEVASHLKIKHTAGSRRGDTEVETKE
ncbi:MAG: hypothetical protein M3Z09_03400 [Acidobacteriota bacterium]|nr:hypothetical protein [Acidobacteriota bacterium]